jgi:hypothetical protein
MSSPLRPAPSEDRPPNPGSAEAVALGCTCPVMDNNRGLSPPAMGGGWWIDGSCPLHRGHQ